MKSLDKRFWLSDWTNSTQHSSDALNGEFFFHSIVASCRPVLADSHDSSYYYYMCTSFYLHYRTVRVGLLQALPLVSVLLRHPYRLPPLSFSLLQYSQIKILLFYLRIAFTISTSCRISVIFYCYIPTLQYLLLFSFVSPCSSFVACHDLSPTVLRRFLCRPRHSLSFWQFVPCSPHLRMMVDTVEVHFGLWLSRSGTNIVFTL